MSSFAAGFLPKRVMRVDSAATCSCTDRLALWLNLRAATHARPPSVILCVFCDLSLRRVAAFMASRFHKYR